MTTLSPLSFEGRPVQAVERDGHILIPGEELGKLLGYPDPRDAVLKIYERNRDELESFSVTVKMTATDGKAYTTRVFSEAGSLLVAMHARTPKAAAVRAWLAELPQKSREALAEANRRLRAELSGMSAKAFELAAASRAQGRREALELLRKLKPATLQKYAALARYVGMGMEMWELRRLTGRTSGAIRGDVCRMRALGLLETAPRPCNLDATNAARAALRLAGASDRPNRPNRPNRKGA